MSHAATVERLLGFTAASKATLLSLSARVESGFPVEALIPISRLVAPDDKGFQTRIVPASTLKRRRREHQRLTPEESERVQRVARAWAAAIDLYHSEDAARAFLTRPHPMLDGQPPLQVALCNAPGLDAVEGLLGRAKYGSAA